MGTLLERKMTNSFHRLSVPVTSEMNDEKTPCAAATEECLMRNTSNMSSDFAIVCFGPARNCFFHFAPFSSQIRIKIAFFNIIFYHSSASAIFLFFRGKHKCNAAHVSQFLGSSCCARFNIKEKNTNRLEHIFAPRLLSKANCQCPGTRGPEADGRTIKIKQRSACILKRNGAKSGRRRHNWVSRDFLSGGAAATISRFNYTHFV
jgi:hypothetical protein